MPALFSIWVILMEKVKRVNVAVNQGDAFFSDSITVADNAERFVFDFKQTSPRFDPSSLDMPEQQTTIAIRHNTVIVNASLAKVFHEMLGERIKQHEKIFGAIKKPSKKAKQKEFSDAATVKPSYLG